MTCPFVIDLIEIGRDVIVEGFLQFYIERKTLGLL